MSNQNADPKRLVTGQVRLSYVHLTAPRPSRQAGEDPKFSVTLLIPKSDFATKQRIDAAINAAIQEGIASKWGGTRPAQPAIPIHDGDGLRPTGEVFTDECKGHWVVTASSTQRPEIVDLNLNPVVQPTEIYSGMYARVSIRFFAYFSNGKKGIGCGLGNVQKVADGEALAGRQSAESDFGSAPAPAPYPPQYAPPAQPPQWQQPQVPQYPPQQPQWQQPMPQQPQQPQWPHQPPQQVPQQPQYPQHPPAPLQTPQQPMQIDPITGKPITGGVWGLGQ